ncbi:thymic stromal lymphopoietin, partial [Bos javanicus]|uniref:thymic stromal lymphopoietin n=1 Tax=Bos javanicus TaxID=9906 RepID=UPI002AA7267B
SWGARGPCGARGAGGGGSPGDAGSARGQAHRAQPGKPPGSRQGGSASYLSGAPGAAPPAARGRRVRDGPGRRQGARGGRRSVSTAPRAAGRGDPRSAPLSRRAPSPPFPGPLRPALRRRVRDRPGADVRAAPGAARTSPERPPRPGPALRRSALPRQAASAHSLPRPSPLSPPPPRLTLPSLSLPLSPPPPPLSPSLPLSLPASSPPGSGAACAQPDCLSKIQSLTFEGRPGCAAPAREAFAVRTHAALAAACPGYRGAQINNTQTMRKIRKRQIKRKECLEQVTYLKELWQRLSRIS